MHNIKSITQKDRYGNMFSLELFEDQGIPMLMMIPDMPNGYNGADTRSHPGKPKGTDTVPAWLTPGENVVNAEASRIPGNQEKIDEMNEQGRAIQQAQGGPIPTYQSQGGTMPAANINGNEFVKAAQAVGLSTDKSTLNKIANLVNQGMSVTEAAKAVASKPVYSASGMEVPRYDGMLNSLGQRLSDRNGGPMYAAEGADVNELLRRFLELEEGQRNTAYLDSAGVPTIGFGSTRGVKMGDKIDDAQARQKLMADMRVAEEDYNKLVTADLNPNQQTAVKSLLFNIGGPQFANSKARAALNAGDFETFQKEASEFRMADGKVLPGLEARRAREMSLFNKPIAQAVAEQQATDKPSIIPPVVGMIGDQKVYSDDMGEFVMTPEGESYLDNTQAKMVSREVPEIAAVPPTPLGERLATEATTAKPTNLSSITDQAKRFAMYPLEFAGLPVDADAPGVPVPNIFDVLPEDPGMTNVNAAIVKNDTENEARLANLINQKKANNETVTPELVQMHKDAVKKLADSKATQAKELSDRAAAKAADEKAVAEAQSYVPEENKVPPKTEDTTKTTDRAAAAAAKVKAAEDIAKQNSTTKPVTQSPEDVNKAGKQKLKEDPTFAEEIKQGFIDMFGEMFNPKEIARMVVMYAGSRALGYDHSASLGYSAKQYVKRIDAEYTQRQKDVRDKDFMEAYTKKSLDNYLKTGDRNDLIEKPVDSSATNITGQSGTTFDRYTGTEVPVYKMGSGKNARLVVRSGDGFVDATSSRFEVVNPKLHDLNEIRDEFQKRLGNQVDELNKTIGKDDPKLDFSTETLADEARALYVSNRDLFRMNNKNAVKLSDEITLAQKDFLQDYKKHIQNPSEFDKPTSIEGYYNKRIIKLKTGNVFSYNDVKNTNPENLDILEETLSNAAANAATNADGNLDRETYVKVYRQLWTDAKTDWKEVKNKDAFKADGYDPIIQWMITEAFK